ncbi:MAG: hypothetical protein QOF30_415 [Acidimicrobiaceae bacterium]|jgi:hypothetical protein|nr:hypothetical protein [Acidimicrobiaceae bacterium]
MTDWATISSLATAGGTLVLAVATFYSVRSANRAARSAERALQVGLRPVLFASRFQDPKQKIRWGDDHWAALGGGQAVVESSDGVVYLAMSLRNVGSGLAVIHGWRTEPGVLPLSPTAAIDQRRAGLVRPEIDQFRPQGRDLYVPPGDISFWQAAIREPEDPDRSATGEVIDQRGTLTIDLLYGDHEGGQRTISRFMVSHIPGNESDWVCSVVRHWNLDRNDPR